MKRDQDKLSSIEQPQQDNQIDGREKSVPGGGTQKSFIRGGSAPRSNPLTFICHFFFRKGTPFVYLLLEKGAPFIYLLKKQEVLLLYFLRSAL